MTAIRVLLMLMMCLVTDAPAPLDASVFEHLEDGEEIQASRRRAVRRPASVQPAPKRLVADVRAATAAPRPQPLAPRTHEHPPRIPMRAADPPDSAEDH